MSQESITIERVFNPAFRLIGHFLDALMHGKGNISRQWILAFAYSLIQDVKRFL